jgi:hypothetical protein
VVKFDALSAEEWGYFLGMFLADGCAVRRTSKVRRRYAVEFSLQGDEIDIAGRLAEMLKRLGLKPCMMVGQRGEYKVNVRINSKFLVFRLPEKRRLVGDAVYRERFLGWWGLSTPLVSVAFLAGLMDGDGSCRVDDYGERLGCLRGRGIGKWKWGFSQTKLPFLVDYVVRVLSSFAPNSVNVYVRVKPGGMKSYDVGFRKSASVALLERGIAKHSLKVAGWERRVAELEKEWESKRYYTVNELARIANVDWHVVKKWIDGGRLKYQRKENTGGGGRNLWYFISRKEAEKFMKAMRRARKGGGG